MGVRRPSRAVDLSADQRRVVEQMALQEREQAMFEQQGLGRADEPYSDPLMGAWNKVVEARIPTENLPGSPTSLGLGVPLTGGPKGLAEWLNTLKYMVEPIMPRDFGASGEHANTPLVGVPKVIGTGVGLGIMGVRAARKPLGRVLSRLFGGGDEAVSAVAPAVQSLPPSVAHRAGRPYFRNVDELEAAAQPAWRGGEPLYHGSGRDMGEFTHLPDHDRSLLMGEGVYTTNRAGHAASYASDNNAILHAQTFGTPMPENVPSYVHSVRFTGAGEPRFLDYGAAGIPDDAKNAVKRAIDDLQGSLTRTGGTVATADELAPLYAKLDNPNVNFAGVHKGSEVGVMGSRDNLNGLADWLLNRNFEAGAIGRRDVMRIKSEVMDALRTGLLDAGYHGYRAPQGGNFAKMPRQGTAAHVDADVYVWLAPDRHLTVTGSGQRWAPPTGLRQEAGLGVPVEDFFGSADDLRLRESARHAPPPTVAPLPLENRFKDMTPEDPWGI